MEFTSFISLLVVGPLAIYFMIIGLLHLSGKILVVSGGRDFAALALAVSGLIAAGPVELFFPSDAMTHFGLYVWGALGLLYLLTILLVILNLRPQLVVYGANAPMVIESLQAAAIKQDETARIQGEFVDLPATELRLRVDGSGISAACRITAISNRVYLRQWLKLSADLQAELREKKSVGAATGIIFVFASLLILAVMTTTIISEPQAIATGFSEWLNH